MSPNTVHIKSILDELKSGLSPNILENLHYTYTGRLKAVLASFLNITGVNLPFAVS